MTRLVSGNRDEARSTMLRTSELDGIRGCRDFGRWILVLEDNDLRVPEILGHGLVKGVLHVSLKAAFTRVGLAVDNQW